MMYDGEISDNTGTSGGVFLDGFSSAVLRGGKISGNTAEYSGGGVWVTLHGAVVDFEKLAVAAGVVFENNVVSVGGHADRDSMYDDVYTRKIAGTDWSAPYTQGYNNYDISYSPIFDIVYYLDGGVRAATSLDFYSIAGIDYISVHRIRDPSRVDYSFVGWTVLYADGSSAFAFADPSGISYLILCVFTLFRVNLPQ